MKNVDRRTRYRYILSLPERVVRSLGALSGGLLKEIGDVALPAAIRRTILYRTMVGVTLRFLIEDVGEVEGVYPSEGRLAENFILQKTASHGIELLGIVAFRASPVWVLAALADVTGGGQRLIRQVVAALQEEGLLEDGANFESMDQILGGLERTSGHLAMMTPTFPRLTLQDYARNGKRCSRHCAAFRPIACLQWIGWSVHGNNCALPRIRRTGPCSLWPP